MLSKLRHKLTLICIVSTAVIVTIITLIALNFSEQQLNTKNKLVLQNILANITEHLQLETSVSYSWLAQMESTNQMIITISTASSSLSFPGSYMTGKNRTELIALAENKAYETYHYVDNKFTREDYHSRLSTIFELHFQGKHYLALMSSLTNNDVHYKILLIQDMYHANKQILLMRIFFATLILTGIIVFGIFSFWFVGKVIQPIALSQKEQTDFVSAASHELRSPLAVIHTSVEELLEDDTILDKHFIHIIDKECTQLTRLVNDLLFLARTDSMNWQITLKPIELDTLLIDIYDSNFSLVKNMSHILLLDLPTAKQPTILIDPERITQVITILINNALTYTPASTSITLSLEHTKGLVKIKVSDNGPGIEDSIKPYIFKRFYRRDPSRHQSEHCGLGLSVAYEIVKLHKGNLFVTDTPSGGATFVIELPLSSDTHIK